MYLVLKSESPCSIVAVHAEPKTLNIYRPHFVHGLKIYVSHVTVMLTSFMKFFVIPKSLANFQSRGTCAT